MVAFAEAAQPHASRCGGPEVPVVARSGAESEAPIPS